MDNRILDQAKDVVKTTTHTDEEDVAESENVGNTNPSQSRLGTSETAPNGSDVNEQIAEEESIGYDQLFGILKNKRRRKVLQYLLDVDDEITLDELAEHIAAEENGKETKYITSQERKRVYVGLYQCHLPKMADYGAISYNRARGKISTGENTELFGHYLPDETDTAARHWTSYHTELSRALALLFLTSILMGALGLITIRQLATVLLVGTLTGMLIGVSILYNSS